MKMYQVGGYVRDEILGVPSKDIDFTVVLDEEEFFEDGYDRNGNTPFEVMTLNLRRQGFKIFLETPEFYTVRAQFPKVATNPDYTPRVLDYPEGMTADFVLARKEGEYTDGRRPDRVEPGSLMDDLARRDFTINAIAKDGDNYIDPFGGISDIRSRTIRAVGNPRERLTEDALRAVRAIRFSVTKKMAIQGLLASVMESFEVIEALKTNISVERIDEEMRKAFRYDTLATLHVLDDFPVLRDAIFSGRLSLEPTLKQRGRGK